MRTPPAVLVIGEFDSFRRSICRAFSRIGITALCAATSAESLRLLETHAVPINLAVIDIVSPRAAILDLSSELARRRPDLPLLYVVGALPSIVRSSLEARVPYAVVAVPFSDRQIIAHAESLVSLGANAFLWRSLMADSRRISTETATLFAYQFRQTGIAALHVELLRAAKISHAIRRTRHSPAPYGLVVGLNQFGYARRLIAKAAAVIRLNPAA